MTSRLASSVLSHNNSQSSACVKMHTPDECIQDKPQRDFLARVGLKIDLLAVVTPLIHQVLAVLIPMSTTTVKLSHPAHELPPLLIFLTRGCSSVNLHNGPHLLLRCQGENTKASTKGHIIRRACPGKHVHHDVACLRNPSKQASTVHFNRAVLNTMMKWHACVNPANKPHHCISTEQCSTQCRRHKAAHTAVAACRLLSCCQASERGSLDRLDLRYTSPRIH